MTFAARAHQAEAASGNPLGTMNLFANTLDDFPGVTDSATVNFNTDGTISTSQTFENNNIVMPTNWYGPTTGGIGNSFGVRFTLLSGTPWSSGLTSGVTYALSSVRSLSWSLTLNQQAIASVLVEIIVTAGGSVFKSGTMSVNLNNEEI